MLDCRRAIVAAMIVLVGSMAVVPRAEAQGHRRPVAPEMRVRGGEQQRRAALERRFRERGEQIVRQRLGLTGEQMRRLREVNQRVNGERRTLLLRERDARIELRGELAKGSGADQARVAALIAQVQQLQRERLALNEQEQRELATFLTPVQQAQFVGLQEQLRARMRELRARAAQGDSGGP